MSQEKRTKFNVELAATILVETLFFGDQKAVARYGITDRTLRNWRTRLAADESFFAIFRLKKESFDAAWLDSLGEPIRHAMNFISEACATMDVRQRSNPEMIHAVAGALKICADIWIIAKALNVGGGPEDLVLIG